MYIQVRVFKLVGTSCLIDGRCSKLSVRVLCGSPVWPSPPVVGPLWGPPLCVGPLCGSPVRVPCVGPLCRSPLCGTPVWVPCVGPSSRCVHVASIRVMSPARSHAPAQESPRIHMNINMAAPCVCIFIICMIYIYIGIGYIYIYSENVFQTKRISEEVRQSWNLDQRKGASLEK